MSDTNRSLPDVSDTQESIAITVATASTPRKKRVKLTIRFVFLPNPPVNIALTHAIPNSPAASHSHSHPDAGSDSGMDSGSVATPPSPGSVIVIPHAAAQHQRQRQRIAARASASGTAAGADGDVKMIVDDAPTTTTTSGPEVPAPALGSKSPGAGAGTKRIKLVVRRPSGSETSAVQDKTINTLASPTGLVRRASSGTSSESDGLVTPESAPHALPAVVVSTSPSSSSGPVSGLMASAWGGKGKGKSVECYALATSPAPTSGRRKGTGKGKEGPWLSASPANKEHREEGEVVDEEEEGEVETGRREVEEGEVGSEIDTDVETEKAGHGGLCAMCAAWQKALRADGGAACAGFAPPDPEACEMCRAGSGAGAQEAAEEGMAVDGPTEGRAEEGEVRVPDETETAALDIDALTTANPADTDGNGDIEDIELDDDAEFLYPDWDPYTLPRDEQFARELLALLHGRPLPLPSSSFTETPSSAFAGASPATPEPSFLSSRPAHVSVV